MEVDTGNYRAWSDTDRAKDNFPYYAEAYPNNEFIIPLSHFKYCLIILNIKITWF